jgi:hypothetical protein
MFLNYSISTLLIMYDFVSSELWIFLICEIIVLGAIVSLASKTSAKY